MVWYAVLFAAGLVVLAVLVGAVVGLVQGRRAERRTDGVRWGDIAIPPCWPFKDELVGGPLTHEQRVRRDDAVRQLEEIARDG